MSTTTKPANLAELRQRLGVQNRQARDSRQLPAQLGRRRRRAVSRHHRLRKHGHPRDQPGPDRRARHAVSRREGAGQEPADAVAGALSRRRDSLHRHSRARRCTTIPIGRSAGVCRRFVAETPEERGAHRLVAARSIATPSGWRRAPSSPTSSARSTRPSWPAARACRPKRRCTSA